jgi:predicted Zn-dependent peptidase
MKYTKDVLDNGLRIITVPMKESQTAIAMVLVETGSEYEDKKINGLSHFLEHMCFKGTTNRSLKEIAEELDGLGAENNAFTGEYYTGYYAKARYSKFPKLMDIISDIYLNPTFPEKDIEIEKGVILEEINLYEDLPMRTVHDVYNELLYGDQPAGRTIGGKKENIKSFKREDFVKYHDTHYIPQKTTVVVAGNVDRKEVKKLVKEKFGNLKKGKIVKKPQVVEKQNKPGIKLHYKKTDQTHLVLGVRSYPSGDKRNMILKIVTTILGGGMSSRLFKRMRDELGMCYYVRVGNHSLLDHGSFDISSGVTNSRTQEAVEVIVEELKRIRDEEIDPKELKKAKDIVLGRLATGLETSEDWADHYGLQELMHLDIETPKDIVKKVKAVTTKDISKVLKKIVVNDGLNLAIVGPHKDPKKFSNALKV